MQRPATVNRELNIISKAFSLSEVPYRPKIEKLKENNIRKGLVTATQLESILENLPANLRGFINFLFITGWRRGEALQLMWKNVDFEGEWLVLEPGTTKNDRGRRFPLTAKLREILEEQKSFVKHLERRYNRIIPYVFVHSDGEQIRSLRRSWTTACQRAGYGSILIHDLRRSAIMNFSKKGIDQQTGMLLSGHKTPSVYRRYNIPTEEVLRKAAEKLEECSKTVTKTVTIGLADERGQKLSS